MYSTIIGYEYEYVGYFGIEDYSTYNQYFNSAPFDKAHLGVGVHHLIERRFALPGTLVEQDVKDWLGQSSNNWSSIVLLKTDEHLLSLIRGKSCLVMMVILFLGH